MNKAQPHLTAVRTKSRHAAVLNSRGASVRSEVILTKRSDKLTLVVDLNLFILCHGLVIKARKWGPLVFLKADHCPGMRVRGHAEVFEGAGTVA